MSRAFTFLWPHPPDPSVEVSADPGDYLKVDRKWGRSRKILLIQESSLISEKNRGGGGGLAAPGLRRELGEIAVPFRWKKGTAALIKE